MGVYVSIIKVLVGKFGFKFKKKGNKEKEVKIGIFVFEVVNIIFKSM